MTFQASRSNSGWTAIQPRDGFTRDKLWISVFQVIAKDLDIDIMAKEEGFLQTRWTVSSSRNYATRLKIRFSEDWKTLYLRCEGRFVLGDGTVVYGTDSQLLSNIRSDLMGLIGRTLR